MRSVCSSCPWQTPQVRKWCNQLITNDDISFGFSRERIIYRILFPCSLLSLFASYSSLPLLYLAVPLISVLWISFSCYFIPKYKYLYLLFQRQRFSKPRAVGAPVPMFSASTESCSSGRSPQHRSRARRDFLSSVHCPSALRGLRMLSWLRTNLRPNRDKERQSRIHDQAPHRSATGSSSWNYTRSGTH